MIFRKKKEKRPAYTLEQAIRKTAEEFPTTLANSLAVIVGNYDEYHRRNIKCKEAIFAGDRGTYEEYNWLRSNSLMLAITEIRRVSEFCQKRYGVSMDIRQDDEESMTDTIADFCELYYGSDCQEIACFR